MKEWFLKYRSALILLGVAVVGALRVAKPEWMLPSDDQVSTYVDAVYAVVSPLVAVSVFYKSSTSTNSLKEDPPNA